MGFFFDLQNISYKTKINKLKTQSTSQPIKQLIFRNNKICNYLIITVIKIKHNLIAYAVINYVEVKNYTTEAII